MPYKEECNGRTFERIDGKFYMNGKRLKTKPFKIDFVLVIKVVAVFFAGAFLGGFIISML